MPIGPFNMFTRLLYILMLIESFNMFTILCILMPIGSFRTSLYTDTNTGSLKTPLYAYILMLIGPF